MAAQVTSAFLYVDDVERSIDFYTEVVGAAIEQIHPEPPNPGPIELAIVRIGTFAIMLHPQDPHPDEFGGDQKVGVGIHLQLKVDSIDAFYQHCIDQGALLAVSGEPVDQPWGWREMALKDPDGYVWSIYEDKSDGRWV